MRRLMVLLGLTFPLAADPIDDAFTRLYKFDFTGAQSVLDRFIEAHPGDPLPHSVKASGFVFQELDRLGILESEFFADDDRIASKRKLKPDAAVKKRMLDSIWAAEERAKSTLDRNGNDTRSLFSLAIAHGVITDYTALVEKRQIASLTTVKSSTGYAQRLLKIDPSYADAYLSTGLTEYVIGSLPFFVKWFVKVEEVKGDKSVAFQNLERTAKEGRYLRPFAKIVLVLGYLREKMPSRARTMLGELAREFPENPLYQREYEKVSRKIERGELRDKR
jgi:hypothetical protein